ncbi:MAG: tetratricopeptide repeat protein [Mariprofundales bacterium]
MNLLVVFIVIVFGILTTDAVAATPRLLQHIEQSDIDKTKANINLTTISNIVVINKQKKQTLIIADSTSSRISQIQLQDNGKLPTSVTDIISFTPFSSATVSGLAVMTNNRFVVLSPDAHLFAVFDAQHKAQFMAGGRGKQGGSLDSPASVAYSPQGHLYIADKGNNRLVAYSDDGLYLFSFGHQGNKKQRLRTPWQITIDAAGRIYALDAKRGGRVSIFDSKGRLITQIGTAQLKHVFGTSIKLSAMSVTPDGIIFIADQRTGRIAAIDWLTGVSLRTVFIFGSYGKGRGQFQNISNMATDGHVLWVVDSANKALEVYDLPNYNTVRSSSRTASMNDVPSVQHRQSLKTPCALPYLLPKKRFLCLQGSNISILNEQSDIITQLEDDFVDPIMAAYDNKMLLILDNRGAHSFDLDGKKNFSLDLQGRGNGEFRQPLGIAVHNYLYVADSKNSRVQVFNRNGVFIRIIGAEKQQGLRLRLPVSLAIDSNTILFVADRKLNRIVAYNEDGTLRNADVLNSNTVKHIYDIMTDNSGLLYALVRTEDSLHSIWVYRNNERIARFSPPQDMVADFFDRSWLTSIVTSKSNATGEVIEVAQQAANRLLEATQDATTGVVSLAQNAFTLFKSEKKNWQISGVPGNESSIAVLDVNKKRMFLLDMQLIPVIPIGIIIGGSAEKVELNWQPSYERFLKYISIMGIDAQGVSHHLSNIAKQKTVFSFSRDEYKQKYIKYSLQAVSSSNKDSQEIIIEDAFYQGLLAMQLGDNQAAKTLLLRAIDNNDQHAEALLLLAKIAMTNKYWGSALAYYQRVEAINGYEQRAQHGKIQLLIDQQQWVKAANSLQSMMTSANTDTFRLCANVHWHLGDIPAVITCLQQGAILDKDSKYTSYWHYRLAQAYVQLGAKKRWLRSIKKAKLAARSVDDWLQIANFYRKQKIQYEVLHALKSALSVASIKNEHEQIQADIMLQIAEVYMQNKSWAKAKRMAAKLAVLPIGANRAQVVLGMLALQDGDATQALIFFNNATKNNIADPRILRHVAAAYIALGQFQSAKDTLHKSIKQQENDAISWRLLAEVCVKQQNIDDAINAAHRSLEIDARQAVIYRLLVTLLLNKHQVDEAAKWAAKALLFQVSNNDVIEGKLLMAEIRLAQGNEVDARNIITTLKRKAAYMTELPLRLAQMYLRRGDYEQALKLAKQAAVRMPMAAAPHAIIGEVYLARQMFTKAITAWEEAIKRVAKQKTKKSQLQAQLYESQINQAYLQQKAMSLAGTSAGITIETANFSKIFSSSYKKYTKHPLGRVRLHNQADIDFQRVKVSLYIKEYMDFPAVRMLDKIKSQQIIDVDVFAAMNGRIVSLAEDTNLQVEIRCDYFLAGEARSETQTFSVEVYGKNAMLWSDMPMAASFVTPKDEVIHRFARQALQQYMPKVAKHGQVNKSLAQAMTLFSVLSSTLNMQYQEDANTPYSRIGDQQVDTVQFPRETLRLRSGDCDDLSVLLATLFENLGIATALLDVPQHLLLMFNTGLMADQQTLISQNPDLLVIRDQQVWIPLEATLISASFSEAWAEGAAKYHRYASENKLNALPLAKGWLEHLPASLPPSDLSLLPVKNNNAQEIVQREWQLLLRKALEHELAPYKAMLALDASDTQAMLAMAKVYALGGLYAKAKQVIQTVLERRPNYVAALNDMANIHYLAAQYTQAQQWYNEAVQQDPDNPYILINLAMCSYQQADIEQARNHFNHAVALDAQIRQQYSMLETLLSR